jgi:hypothetical protein
MKAQSITSCLLAALAIFSLALSQLSAQRVPAHNPMAELRLQIVPDQPGKHRSASAVMWLDPLAGTPAVLFPSGRHYVLLQKNRTFVPHLQVVPVGGTVQFPNADPFFHNVFSLFDGKRFDLGLYEAGSSKSVTFSREGVSYIFCNIHPEMSAVIISIPADLYGMADVGGSIVVSNIPPGDYRMQVWVEGVPQSFLGHLIRTIHLAPGRTDLGILKVPIPDSNAIHTNKFGHTYEYEQEQSTPY